MAKLTQEEMAVLNALIYIDSDKDIWNGREGRLIDLVEELENSGWKPAFDEMSDEECKDIFRAVRSNPSLGQLELVAVKESDYAQYNTKPSDARVLAFRNGENPVVVFRGTTGERELLDNEEGAHQADTDAQQRALAYVNILHDKYGFDHISVTGHSKGGNKAMYTAVLSDYVDDCTAFDAQGFSNEFLVKYSDRIEAKKDKITAYITDYSIIGALLYSIAGKTVCISTKDVPLQWSLMGFFRHKPTIFSTIDENGVIRFHEGTSPSPWYSLVNGITAVLVSEFSWGIGITEGAAYLAKGDYEKANAAFQALAEKIGQNYIYHNEHILSNWMKGVNPGGLPPLSTQIGGFISENFGLPKELFSFDMDAEADAGTILQTLGDRFRLLVDWTGGSENIMEAASRAAMAITAITVWTAVKALELVIPTLLNTSIALTQAARLGVIMVVSWIAEKLAKFAETMGNAIGGFLSGLAAFFQGMVEGVGDWFKMIFGSGEAAISQVQNVAVTMSRLEELGSMVSDLGHSYENVKRYAGSARAVTDRVYNYYNESYVRSSCRDIQNNLKTADKYLAAARRNLDRKQKKLREAADAYKKADQKAVQIILD